MGYLSKLRQDTTARAVRTPQPTWLHAIPLVVESTEVETPVNESPDLNPGTAQKTRDPEHDAVFDPTPVANLRPLEISHSDEESDIPLWVPRDQAATAHDSAEIPLSRSDPQPANVSPSYLPSGSVADTPRSVAPTRVEAALTPAAPTPQVRAVSSGPNLEKRDSPQAGPTLAEILAEIERRQLDLRQRDRRETEVLSGGVSADSRRSAAEVSRGREETSLNIGSIVVEMEPGPVKPAPRPVLRVRPQQDRDWPRSFLDRW